MNENKNAVELFDDIMLKAGGNFRAEHQGKIFKVRRWVGIMVDDGDLPQYKKLMERYIEFDIPPTNLIHILEKEIGPEGLIIKDWDQVLGIDINVYFSEGALQYFGEAGPKDYFKKFLVGAANPKYRKLTNDELADIEGLQETYGAKSLGTPANTIPIKLTNDIELGNHASEQMQIRKISTEDLQKFIDHSMFMFIQDRGKTRLYIASNGSIAISVRDNPNGRIATIYSIKDYYSNWLAPIVKEVQKWLKIN